MTLKEYNPKTLEGNPEEALLKSIKAARGFALLAKSEERMRVEEREAFVHQSRGMYQFAIAVAKSVELKATGQLIYKEFDGERVKMGRALKAYKKERVNQGRKHSQIERGIYRG
jgi:hypothetical protein